MCFGWSLPTCPHDDVICEVSETSPSRHFVTSQEEKQLVFLSCCCSYELLVTQFPSKYSENFKEILSVHYLIEGRYSRRQNSPVCSVKPFRKHTKQPEDAIKRAAVKAQKPSLGQIYSSKERLVGNYSDVRV